VTGAGGGRKTRTVAAGHSITLDVDPLRIGNGWYDVTVSGRSGYVRRFSGHLENGRPSTTG
jgi:phospholipase C